MNIIRYIPLLFSLCVTLEMNAQNFFVEENAAIFIQENAGMQFGGDLENEGFIENNGSIDLYADFDNRNIFNGSMGSLALLGGVGQMVVAPLLELRSLMLNGDGTSMFQSDSVVISEGLDFTNGVLFVADDTDFVLLDGAEVTGGNESSYLDGAIVQFGTGYKYYPLGDSLYFDPIEMLNISGVDVKMKVTVSHPAPFEPDPARYVIGVSEHAMWQVDLLEGLFDSTLIRMDFAEADLENFTNRNSINFLVSSPVVVYSDSLGGEFETLGVSELLDTDSLTTGIVTSEFGMRIERSNTAYVAVGRAPLVPPDGVVHIPNAFSPAATEVENRTYTIKGEKILNEDFRLQIFNRFNVLVYETNDFREASTRGWDGINQSTGIEEPAGVFYYSVRLKRENGEVVAKDGPLYLIR